MFYKDSPNKEKAFTEGFDNSYGTHTGFLNYEPSDDTWYVTHNIHGKIHKDKFGALQNSKSNIGVTAIYQPRKNSIYNRVKKPCIADFIVIKLNHQIKMKESDKMDFTRLKYYIDSLAANDLPYCDISVRLDRKEVFRHNMGYIDAEHTKKPQPDTLQWIYSMSKVITCTAVLRLVEKGLLSLEDKVSIFLQ